MPMYLRLWLSLFRNFDVVSAAASSVLGFGKMEEIQHMHSYDIALPMLLAVSPFLNMSPNTVYICPLACLSPLPSTASIFNSFI
uniref:AP-1 complex subunit gamma-2, putative n=1 Tax=Arundo donax TaxID=35708 RepID=A0A0A9DVE8_ARUDO